MLLFQINIGHCADLLKDSKVKSVTIWSVVIQSFFIRKWCLFCCAICLILWVNVAILFHLPCEFSLSIYEASSFIFLFFICLSGIRYWTKKHDTQSLIYAYQRKIASLKFNPKVLQSLANEQYNVRNIGFIWKTNNNDNECHNVTLYVSLRCSHCGAAVKQIQRLIDIYPSLNYQLIFAVRPEMDAALKEIIDHFADVYYQHEKDVFFNMLECWYKTRKVDIGLLRQKFPVFNDFRKDNVIKSLYDFNQQVKFDYSPALLLNGKLLPLNIYSYADLFSIVQ